MSVFIGIYLIFASDFSLSEIEVLQTLVPPRVLEILDSIITSIKQNNTALNVGTIVSLFFSIWLANNLTQSLSIALQRILKLPARRTDFLSHLKSLFYTLLLILSVITFVFTLTVLPIILDAFNFGFFNLFLIYIGRWLLAACYMVALITFIYRYLPQYTRRKKLRNFIPGALMATFFGGVVAILFSIYVINFGKYNQVYGVLSTIVVFLIWLRLSFTSLFLGAKFNSYLQSENRLASFDYLKKIKNNISLHPISTFLLGFLSIIIMFRTALPSVLRSELNNRILKSPYEGRIGDVDISFIKGLVKFENVSLKKEEDYLFQLDVENIIIDFNWWDLVVGKFRTSLYMQNLDVRYGFTDKGEELLSLLDLMEMADNFIIPELKITNGNVTFYQSAMLENSTSIRNFNFVAQNISSDYYASALPVHLAFFGHLNKGIIYFNGQTDLAMKKDDFLQMKLVITNVEVNKVINVIKNGNYLPNIVDLKIKLGALNGKTHGVFRATTKEKNEIIKFDFNGEYVYRPQELMLSLKSIVYDGLLLPIQKEVAESIDKRNTVFSE